MRKFSWFYVTFLSLSLCTLIDIEVKAADTTLIGVITLPYNVNTIASDSVGTIWISGARGIQYYDFERENFITTDPSYKSHIVADQGEITRFKGRLGRVFFPWHEFNEWLSQIPPGYDRVSVARDKFGHYWVSTGSQLLIFAVEERFEQILPGYSTRGIYQDGEDLYVNSYLWGILKNGQPLFEKPAFAEGEIKKFGESLYFAWGGLIRYMPLHPDFQLC